jgi:hypothetical protein
MIPLPWMILGITLLIGSAGIVGYQQGSKHTSDRIEAQTAREAAMVAEAQDVALRAAAEAIAKIDVQSVTIKQRTEREIVRIPADCVAPDSLLDLTNEAITGEPASDSGVPATDADAGGDVR